MENRPVVPGSERRLADGGAATDHSCPLYESTTLRVYYFYESELLLVSLNVFVCMLCVLFRARFFSLFAPVQVLGVIFEELRMV